MLSPCVGCVSHGGSCRPAAYTTASPTPIGNSVVAAPEGPRPITPVAYQEPGSRDDSPAAGLSRQVAPANLDDPLLGIEELSLAQLTAEVQARNPSVQAMIAAWRAASERYPQVISLDDPMFNFMLGAAGLGQDGGWMVMASQKVPWCGKRALKGAIAQAEADAASRDVDDVRLRLAEATAMALADYYQARRELEINTANRELTGQFRDIAKVRYESNQVPEQDVLQATLELADLEGRRAEVTREEKVAVARINTLLHRAADHPLPPPPSKLDTSGDLPPVETLRDWAVERRPDLAAEDARIRADEASLDLADREFYPDLEVVTKYDAFMPENMRPQVGLNLNVPIRRTRRCAALQEAAAKLQQRRAELQSRVDEVHFEVQSASDRLAEQRNIIHLYAEKTLPAAEENVRHARANYTAGKIDFLRLIDAERQLYRQQEKYQQAIADYQRRSAELERAVGGPLSAM